MYLARVRANGRRVLAARIRPGTLVRLDDLPDDPVRALVELGTEQLQTTAERAADAGRLLDETEVAFDVPVPRPQKIICVALNYLAHAAEGEQVVPDEPVIFFKPPSALAPHGATVRCPARSSRLEYEVELALVVGRRATGVPAAAWADVVCGYTVLNDVTARDLQLDAMRRNQPWDHSKAFDTFAPCGPYLVTRDEVPDPMSLDLALRVGEQVRQESNTRHMIFDIPTLLQVVSDGITLEPGDIIATGTPAGIGRVDDGEVMTADVERVGTLVNPVMYERELMARPA